MTIQSIRNVAANTQQAAQAVQFNRQSSKTKEAVKQVQLADTEMKKNTRSK